MRRTQTITIEAEGRDKGKTFLLTEMSAYAAEKWAAKAFLAMARSGSDIPEHVINAGLAGIGALGLRALGAVTFAEAEPLLDEMFGCITIVPDPGRSSFARQLVENDIEEVFTRLQLRRHVFELHTSFFNLVAQSKSASASATQTTDGPSP